MRVEPIAAGRRMIARFPRKARILGCEARLFLLLVGGLLPFTSGVVPATAQQPAAPPPPANVQNAAPASSAAPQTSAPAAPAPNPVKINILYIGRQYQEPPPLSLVDKIVTDKGIQGARIALQENGRTGKFLDQDYHLSEMILGLDENFLAKAKAALASGQKLILADLNKDDLLALADLPEAKDAIILDIRTSDDVLRQEQCRANVFHMLPSWAMRADALAQYLLWKKWQRWLLITGKQPDDLGYAAAVKRAASRFGSKIVDERTYAYAAGSRRTDTGHQLIQQQMPLVTQGAPAYDVAFVADENETFGEYLPYRTSDPRPVVGTQGLAAVAWSKVFEEYGAAQEQNRFERQVGRVMTERDYSGWLGVRAFGEAATRINSAKPADIRAYFLSDDFKLPGFKGEPMSFRTWDLQLRQPVLLASARDLVSISPQEGFLHPKFLTDTLGFDQPETKCRLNK